MQDNSIKTGEGAELPSSEGADLATATRPLTKAEQELIKRVRSLTPEKKAIILAVVRLMAEGQNGIPFLTPAQRAHALETFLPELERLRAAPDFNPEMLQAVEAAVAKAAQLQRFATEKHLARV